MIKAAFEFILKNPPTILMGGGILFLFFGYIINIATAIAPGWILISIGGILHLVWLWRCKR